jgi:UPF0176 protein
MRLLFAEQHLAFCERLGIVGRIIVADEGLNGTISGTVVQCKKYMDQLKKQSDFCRH